ncbi:hypothetical protein [Gulosibacter chungangensis]|uniref:hypothetical protein n=1 Tax=Gulosibacter chungangensis TaxID=979746 RepID=UPI001CE402F2|nr:hypothetical protein [Gulosibacter chungangensis]
MLERPWSNRQLAELGKAIRAGREAPKGVPEYEEVMLWYSELLTPVQQRIQNTDWSALGLGNVQGFELTSRVKTQSTLRDKLNRYPSQKLQTIRDIAGVRFEADMTLSQQNAIVLAMLGLFHDSSEGRVIDLRENDQHGYRAVHVEFRFGPPTHARVELQVRTLLQGKWANLYETAADLFGREIRYAEAGDLLGGRDIVEMLKELSRDRIATIEELLDRTVQLERSYVNMGDISILPLEIQEQVGWVVDRLQAIRENVGHRKDRLRVSIENMTDVLKQATGSRRGDAQE